MANEQGVGEMERWIGQAEEVHAESSRRIESMRGELVMAEGTATSQREAGVSALRDVTEGMRSRLEEYGAETHDMATSQVAAVDGFCEKMGSTAVDGESRAISASLTISIWTSRRASAETEQATRRAVQERERDAQHVEVTRRRYSRSHRWSLVGSARRPRL